jgi:histone H3/H4
MATTTATKKTAAAATKRAPKAPKAAGAAKDKKRSAASAAAATTAPAPTPEPQPIAVDQPLEEIEAEDGPIDVEMGDAGLDNAGEESGLLENDEAAGYDGEEEQEEGQEAEDDEEQEDEEEKESAAGTTPVVGGGSKRKGGVSKRKGAPISRGRSKEVTREYLLSEKDRKDLSSAALRKISLKAGVETLSRTAYDAVRATLKAKLTSMINEACQLAGFKSRRTVTTEDAGAATKMFLGSDAAKGDFHKVRRYRRPAPRKANNNKGTTSSDDAGSVASDDVASTITSTTTSRRVGGIGGDQSLNRPRGAVTKERIAEYSNQSRDTVFIPLEAFSRILHRINDTEYKCKGVELNGKRLSAFRWQPEAVHMVHHALEVIATNLFRSALLLARTRERKSVTAADVDTVVELNSNFAAVRA